MSAFIDAQRARFGVEPICREIVVSASAYRARRTRPPSRRATRDAWLLAQIRRLHLASHGIYGQLTVWDDLRDEGICVARCTVERLMRAGGIAGVSAGKSTKTTLPGARPVAAPDLVGCNFTASRPDELRLADFTYIRTWEGWSYLAVTLDVYTRRIVGWQLASHMRQSLVSDAFDMALAARQEHDGGLVAHSDNGSQLHLLRIHRAPQEGRHRSEPGMHGHGARQRHGRERDLDHQARARLPLHLEDAARLGARPDDLHRLVQLAAPAPLSQTHERRADQTAGANAGTRAVQSGGRRKLGAQIIKPPRNPGRSSRGPGRRSPLPTYCGRDASSRLGTAQHQSPGRPLQEPAPCSTIAHSQR